MKAIAGKVKFANLFAMLMVMDKNAERKLLQILIPLEKWIQSSCQKCMDMFFDLYFDILLNWAGYFELPQKSLPKFYL